MMMIMVISTLAVVLWKVGQASWVKCLSNLPERWPCNCHHQSHHQHCNFCIFSILQIIIIINYTISIAIFQPCKSSSLIAILNITIIKPCFTMRITNLGVTARYRTFAVLQGRIGRPRLPRLWM